MQDVTTFLHKSFSDLDTVTRTQIAQKGEIYLEETYKPLSLNVKKALDVVQKFEMVWPDKDGNDARGAGKPKLHTQYQKTQVGVQQDNVTTG